MGHRRDHSAVASGSLTINMGAGDDTLTVTNSLQFNALTDLIIDGQANAMLTAIIIALCIGAVLGTFVGWKLGRGWEKMTPRARTPLRPKIR